MKDHSVPALLGIHWGSLGSKQDIEVGVEEDKPDQDQEDDATSVVLLFVVRISEQCGRPTEDPGMEEIKGLHPKHHEEIW